MGTLLFGDAIPPAAVGLRGDGALPPPGAWELTGQTALFAETGEACVVDGVQAAVRVGTGPLGLPSSLSVACLLGEPLPMGEADLLVAIVEGGLSLSASAGVGILTPGRVRLDPQAGVTVGRTFAGAITPYVGARVIPYVDTLLGDAPSAWVIAGGGVTWRHRVGPVTGVLGVEASGYHGFDVLWIEHRDGPWTVEDDTAWALAIQVGVRLGGR